LLALGLADRIVGAGFLDAPLPQGPDDAEIHVLSDRLPSQEVILGTDPDFIYAGWESNFAADGAGERQTLARLGIPSYVAPAACRSVKPPKLAFTEIFREIKEMG